MLFLLSSWLTQTQGQDQFDHFDQFFQLINSKKKLVGTCVRRVMDTMDSETEDIRGSSTMPTQQSAEEKHPAQNMPCLHQERARNAVVTSVAKITQDRSAELQTISWGKVLSLAKNLESRRVKEGLPLTPGVCC